MTRCPKCGYENPDGVMNCKNCRINLEFAFANLQNRGGQDRKRQMQELKEPTTSREWRELTVLIDRLTAEDLPKANTASIAEFKDAVRHATAFRWHISLLALIPAIFLQVTENLLKIASWGALWHLAAVGCIFAGYFLQDKLTKEAQEQALVLGRRAGVFLPTQSSAGPEST